jgi:hypothetical protein
MGRREEAGGVAVACLFHPLSLTTHNLTISVPLLSQMPCQLVSAKLVTSPRGVADQVSQDIDCFKKQVTMPALRNARQDATGTLTPLNSHGQAGEQFSG